MYMDKINSSREYKMRFDLGFWGHFHDPMSKPFKSCHVITNGALVPPNGHARAAGYANACGQWLWESVEGHIVGDNRYLYVGKTDDVDATLDEIVKPYEW